jgi:hypothetical protein
MVSIIERCCRTCAALAPDPYRASLRCVAHDQPASANGVCHLWWLNEKVVGGTHNRRDIVLVSAIPDAGPDLGPHG